MLHHFITSRYFINFLPLFFITLYLSLDAIEVRFERLKRFMRLKLLFVILFITSNLVISSSLLPLREAGLQRLSHLPKEPTPRWRQDYSSETCGYIPGILHYFGVYPEGRHYIYSTFVKIFRKRNRIVNSFIIRTENITISIITFKTCLHPICCRRKSTMDCH